MTHLKNVLPKKEEIDVMIISQNQKCTRRKERQDKDRETDRQTDRQTDRHTDRDKE